MSSAKQQGDQVQCSMGNATTTVKFFDSLLSYRELRIVKIAKKCLNRSPSARVTTQGWIQDFS